jgi:hypothetical protein
MHEPEYSLIPNTSLLSHNKRLFYYFENSGSVKAIKFPKEITKDELVYKIACFITPEAKSSQEIMEWTGVKRATLQRVFVKLSPYLEKRGSKGIGIYYQIDTTLIDNNLHINKDKDSLLTNPNSKNNNIKEIIGVTLLLIIASNTLFFSHFFPFSFKTFKSPEDLFSLRNATHSSLLGSSRPYVLTALVKKEYFPHQLANSTIANRQL